jgi:hypothetical protein
MATQIIQLGQNSRLGLSEREHDQRVYTSPRL